MKKIKFLIVLTTWFQLLFAQESKIVFRDDFNDNKNNWENINTSKEGAKISNGTYIINTDKSLALRMFFQQIFIDYRENFRIETSVKQSGGDESSGYGLIWGSLGWKDSYSFLVSSTGYFCIGTYKNGEYVDIKEWAKSNVIKPLGQYNKLVIEKSGINFTFLINDTPVFTCRFQNFAGQLHGFIARQNVTMASDYLLVTSEPPKIDIVTTNLSSLKKENMGLEINSPYTEIAPIISPDGNTLYVGRIYHPKNFGKEKECDIWYSTKGEDDKWSPLKNIGKPLNNDGVNVVITVTPDGNALLLEGLYNSDGSHLSEKGISISYKTENGWSIPKEVKIKNYQNKNIYETYCLSADRKVLLLSVERDDSFGDLDMYVSFLQENGEYSEPKNMGAVLNTFAPDGTPFLATDNVTLYYSSYGKQGYGSADIFMTRRLDDTWLSWSAPKNLGASINTNDWDTYLSIAASGNLAYLVSNHGSYGNEDIFQLKLDEEEIKPDPVVLIYGKVLNEKTKKPIGAKISYENLKTGKEVGLAQSDPKTGEYKIILPYGIEYGFRAESKDFISINENIDLKKIKEYTEIKRDLLLVPLEVGETIVLKNVFFNQSKATLMETSYPELDRLVKIMKEHPKLEIELNGHTENRGDAKGLLKLSEERVKAVEDYLISKGIDEKRITGIGFGGTKPLNTGATEEERILNRRVEFKILKK